MLVRIVRRGSGIEGGDILANRTACLLSVAPIDLASFDAVFLGPDGRVAGLCGGFRRNRVSRFFRSARGVLELPEGTIGRTGTAVGDEIRFEVTGTSGCTR